MAQRRVCEYLGLSCTHYRTFLCLPESVRHRIYQDAGLVTDMDIDLNRPLAAKSSLFRPDPEPEPWLSFKKCYGLLLTCHAIYLEVSTIIYSSNRFFINYRPYKNLRGLRYLRATSISSLTCLTIHLNVVSCEWREICCEILRDRFAKAHGHDKPLGSSSNRTKEAFSEWQRTASHIGAHSEHAKLQLHFVCDVEDPETAELVLRPFLSLPKLKDCGIRLGRNPDYTFQGLARKTAMQATGKLQGKSAEFPFYRLPKEIRRQILEYTDLITPYREVEWSSESEFCLRQGLCNVYCDRECIHGGSNRFRNCSVSKSVGCFCQRYHSAFSLTCQCWIPPTPLFLVCRSLRNEAQAIFFGSNRFVLIDSGGFHNGAKCTPARLDVSVFLQNQLKSNTLQFLKYLEVVFPPLDEKYLKTQDEAYKDWLDTIDYVALQEKLSNLTLRIYVTDYDYHWAHGNQVPEFRRNMTYDRGMEMYGMYLRIIRPLSKLREELKQFFAHLPWPLSWTDGGIRLHRVNQSLALERTAKIETRIEQLVMGNGYNSGLLRKRKQENSQWLLAFLEDAYRTAHTSYLDGSRFE